MRGSQGRSREAKRNVQTRGHSVFWGGSACRAWVLQTFFLAGLVSLVTGRAYGRQRQVSIFVSTIKGHARRHPLPYGNYPYSKELCSIYKNS